RVILTVRDRSGRMRSAGTASASESKTILLMSRHAGLHFRSSQQRPFAVSAGVTALHSPGLVKLYDAILHYHFHKLMVRIFKPAKTSEEKSRPVTSSTLVRPVRRRLISRPRKAKCFFVAVVYART